MSGTRVIGLTGGIASGKSAVAGMLRDLGAPVIDADLLAREVVAPGSDGLAAIRDQFGPDLLDETGALDRQKMGDLVFRDPEARRKLNAITHPRIAAASQREIARAAADGHRHVVYEAALIVENGLQSWMHALIVVSVPESVQRARLMARDQIDEQAARARIAAQLPLADKVAVADYVVDNSGTLDATRARVAEIWRTITEGEA
jgi:dephospho-CoA kinase